VQSALKSPHRPAIILIESANAGHGTTRRGHGTVTDTLTGLMWEMQTSTCSGEVTCSTNMYYWSESSAVADGTLFTGFIAGLNGGDFAHHCDWRIPTIAELQTIIESGASGCGSGSPCIDSAFGPTQTSYYWSSSTFTGNLPNAWAVSFNNGNVNNMAKPFDNSARAVRGSR
jgi:hypothetical protein